jgi:hypothetical protein
MGRGGKSILKAVEAHICLKWLGPDVQPFRDMYILTNLSISTSQSTSTDDVDTKVFPHPQILQKMATPGPVLIVARARSLSPQ